MIPQAIIPGTNAFFVPESATITRAAKPATEAYADLGPTAEGSELTPSIGTEREIYKNVGGGIELYDVIESKRKLDVKLKLEEYSDLVNALVFGHDIPTGTTAHTFRPLSRKKAIKGWLKLELETDAGKIVSLEAYTRIKLDGNVTSGDKGPQPPLVFNLLYSPLNTGTLLGVSA
jgi:hypothetical protein